MSEIMQNVFIVGKDSELVEYLGWNESPRPRAV